MPTSASSVRLASLVLAALLATAVGCGDDHGHEDDGGHGGASTGTAGGDLADVVYEGSATDEALVELLAASAVEDGAQAAALTAPAAGTALDPATVVDFTWEVGSVPRHGDPLNGRAYLVVFSTPASPELLRVFTTNLTYTPDADAWATITGAGEAVSVTITNAVFEQNRVAQGGGPWVGPTVTLGD